MINTQLQVMGITKPLAGSGYLRVHNLLKYVHGGDINEKLLIGVES